MSVKATYDVAHATNAQQVVALELATGATQVIDAETYTWYRIKGTKYDTSIYTIWLLANKNPFDVFKRPSIKVNRYILQEGAGTPLEYVDKATSKALLPWCHFITELMPTGYTGDVELPPSGMYLGKAITQTDLQTVPAFSLPGGITTLTLDTEMLIGVASNLKQPAGTAFVQADYTEMIAAGMNHFVVDETQEAWVYSQPVFYNLDGTYAGTLKYPEILYRSNFRGVHQYIDEPIQSLHIWLGDYPAGCDLPQAVHNLQGYCFKNYASLNSPGDVGGSALRQKLIAQGIDLGTLQIPDSHLDTWEAFPGGAMYELQSGFLGICSEGAALYEQLAGYPWSVISLDSIAHDAGYGFSIPLTWVNSYKIEAATLRGAARFYGKQWGVGIYDWCEVTHIVEYLENAYDKGATYFRFYNASDSVPYADMLTYVAALVAHAAATPRTMATLLAAATTCIVVPWGYMLECFWNEAKMYNSAQFPWATVNSDGKTWAQVQGEIGQKIYDCITAGVVFDLAIAVDGFTGAGYTDVYWVKPDCTVQHNGSPISNEVKRSVSASPLVGAITLDGQLTESDWGTITDGETTFKQLGLATPATKQTFYKVRYDNDALYLGIRCTEPNMAGIVSALTDGNDMAAEDSVEVYLIPKDEMTWYRFNVNAIGSKFSVLCDCTHSMNQGTKVSTYTVATVSIPYADWTVAAYKSADYWSVEIRIPWSLLCVGQKPTVGDKWRINVCRNCTTAADTKHTWAQLWNAYNSYYNSPAYNEGYHEPESFGVLEIQGGTSIYMPPYAALIMAMCS